MDFNFSDDLTAIREILSLSQSELADQIGVRQLTISRNESGDTGASDRMLERVYSYAFGNNVRLNKIKAMLWRDELHAHEKLLYHGAKSELTGEIDPRRGRANNDFGQGFYAGESYEQAVSLVSGFQGSCVYYLRFDERNLKCRRYEVDLDWMMTIAFYRGALDAYRDRPFVQTLVERSRDCDYIIAPIADNRMFQIIYSFLNGDITDEQCKHCLAATNLGMQYIFISEKAAAQVTPVERCYLSENERAYHRNLRAEESRLGDDKVRLAKIRYRGQGRYIDEILQ